MHPQVVNAAAILAAGGCLKYAATLTLVAGVTLDHTTTVPIGYEPVNISVYYLTAGVYLDITPTIEVSFLLVGNNYHVYLTSVVGLVNIHLKVIY